MNGQTVLTNKHTYIQLTQIIPMTIDSILNEIQLQYRSAEHGISQLALSQHYTKSEKLIMFNKIVSGFENLLESSIAYRDSFKCNKE